MRKKLNFLTSILVGVTGVVSAQGKYEFVIKGKLGHVVEPAKVYIIYGDRGIHSDSAEIKNNEFTLPGSVGIRQRVNIYMWQNGKRNLAGTAMDQTAIYLEGGTIEISSPDSLKHAKLGGTQLNIDQQEYVNSLGNIKELQQGIIQRYNTEKDSVKRFNLTMEYKQLDVLLQSSLANFIESHPNSLVAMHVLRNNFNPVDNVELAASLYNSFSDSIKNSSSGGLYKESIDNVYKLGVGRMAPDFAANDLMGVERHLSDFRGKYVLLDFWASWCGPCRKESPNLINSYTQYKDKKFDIISFSVDKETEDWKQAVAKDKLTWTNLKDTQDPDRAVAKLYGVTALPTNYLLDPTGKIIATNLRGEELEKQLKQILN